MEMSLEDFKKEEKICLLNIVNYEVKKNPKYLEPIHKLKYYLSKKDATEKDIEIIEKYLSLGNI